MQENLVIVESPAKAKTIEKFLGKDFIVKSSYGHIRDLSKKDLGIDIKEGFRPVYEIPADKKKVVDELAKLAKKKTVWLASDEDREGEAIAWHLTEVLGLPVDTTKRIVFHEITKRAILEAIETPRTVNMNLVNAQQARRVLDRLVGFELSPVLWKRCDRRSRQVACNRWPCGCSSSANAKSSHSNRHRIIGSWRSSMPRTTPKRHFSKPSCRPDSVPARKPNNSSGSASDPISPWRKPKKNPRNASPHRRSRHRPFSRKQAAN